MQLSWINFRVARSFCATTGLRAASLFRRASFFRRASLFRRARSLAAGRLGRRGVLSDAGWRGPVSWKLAIGIVPLILLCGNAQGISAEVADEAISVKLPDVPIPDLQPYSRLEIPAHLEPSGLVKSRRWDDVYWAHNDSGDLPRIFAVRRNGSIYPSARQGAAHGVHIPDAVNVDWEDIAVDDQGHVVIGDFGNSEQNDRRDLCLYFIFEPHPTIDQTSVVRKVFFHYPDQLEVPSPVRNFDAEALFFAGGHFYILTKHRSDQKTTLYRVDAQEPFRSNPLTRLRTFDIQGQVTGADASVDGRRLAVLTYSGVWVFDAVEPEKWFEGAIRWLPLPDGDQEAITIDGEHLLISAGEGDGDLFDIPLSDLKVVRPAP